jgi:hypothetical protein
MESDQLENGSRSAEIKTEVHVKSLILLAAFVLFFSTNGFCHNPAGIKVTFKEKTMDVVVSHPVSDPATHYVKKIEVKLNGGGTAEKVFTSQTDDMAQRTTFDIAGFKKGDVLELTAYCIRGGDVTERVTIK